MNMIDSCPSCGSDQIGISIAWEVKRVRCRACGYFEVNTPRRAEHIRMGAEYLGEVLPGESGMAAYRRLVAKGADLPKDRHRRSGWFKPGWEYARFCDTAIYPGKVPEPFGHPGTFNPSWISFDEAAELPEKALDDIADAQRDRRLRALEDQVARLLVWQDRQLGAKKEFEGLVATARKAVLKPKPPAKRKKR